MFDVRAASTYISRFVLNFTDLIATIVSDHGANDISKYFIQRLRVYTIWKIFEEAEHDDSFERQVHGNQA